MVKALGRVGEGAEIIVEPRPENEITGAQIRAARELLGWARDRLCPTAGLSATLLGKIEDGLRTPTNEQLPATKEPRPARGAVERGSRRRACRLFDHLIGGNEEFVWHSEPKRLGGREIDC